MPPGAARGTHWDFMLEREGVLRTWAIDDLPSRVQTIAAHALPDHRLDYLDYEGPVSGNRGSVTCYDRGEYELLDETLERLRITLHGEKMDGRMVLTRAGANDEWQIEFVSEQIQIQKDRG